MAIGLISWLNAEKFKSNQQKLFNTSNLHPCDGMLDRHENHGLGEDALTNKKTVTSFNSQLDVYVYMQMKTSKEIHQNIYEAYCWETGLEISLWGTSGFFVFCFVFFMFSS